MPERDGVDVILEQWRRERPELQSAAGLVHGDWGPVLNVVWDARGLVARDSAGVVRQFGAEKSLGLRRMQDPSKGGASLARSLLRHNAAENALELLEAVYPPTFGSDLDRTTPGNG